MSRIEQNNATFTSPEAQNNMHGTDESNLHVLTAAISEIMHETRSKEQQIFSRDETHNEPNNSTILGEGINAREDQSLAVLRRANNDLQHESTALVESINSNLLHDNGISNTEPSQTLVDNNSSIDDHGKLSEGMAKKVAETLSMTAHERHLLNDHRCCKEFG